MKLEVRQHRCDRPDVHDDLILHGLKALEVYRHRVGTRPEIAEAKAPVYTGDCADLRLDETLPFHGDIRTGHGQALRAPDGTRDFSDGSCPLGRRRATVGPGQRWDTDK